MIEKRDIVFQPYAKTNVWEGILNLLACFSKLEQMIISLVEKLFQKQWSNKRRRNIILWIRTSNFNSTILYQNKGDFCISYTFVDNVDVLFKVNMLEYERKKKNHNSCYMTEGCWFCSFLRKTNSYRITWEKLSR